MSEDNIIVGIVTSPNEDGYFNNGLHQNAYYLYKLYKNVPRVTPLLMYPNKLVKGKPSPDQSTIFGEPAYNLDLFKEKYGVHALLFVSAVIPRAMLKPFRDNGVKLATVVYGNRYVMDQEAIVFGHLESPAKSMTNFAKRNLWREDGDMDAVWLSPHFGWQKDYIKHRYAAQRSFICPYIWDPELLDLKYDEHDHYKKNPRGFTVGHPGNKNIFCTEPNINVLKTSLFPYQAADIAYRDGGDLNKLYLYNTKDMILNNKDIAFYMSQFPLTLDKKIVFEHRYGLPAMTKTSKVMFHHHFENGLNYTLLECARLGLPVVHNSEFMPELGYYYHKADLTAAAAQIKSALKHEERDDLDEYNQTAHDVIRRFSISNAQNLRGYQTLLANLLDNSLGVELPEYIVEYENKYEASKPSFSPMSE